jgi:predicted transcriptional regulator
MAESELDMILAMLGNPVRRRIVKRLSQESSYSLQIAKELGFGQQLVAKHLDTMEQAGVVASSLEPSPHGPKRRSYVLSKNVSVTVSLAPHLFSTRITSLSAFPEEGHVSKASSILMNRLNEISRYPVERSRIAPFGALLDEIDSKIEKLEDERAVLLYIRNAAMKEASRMISDMRTSRDAKMVLYHVLDDRASSIGDISAALNMRESVVRQILTALKKDFLTA